MTVATLITPLQGEFGTATALQLTLVGAGCGAIGVWVVRLARTFVAESLAHAVLPGLVVATLLGTSVVAGAVAGIALAYGALWLSARAPHTAPASATSVAVTALVAGGALLATAGSEPLRIESLLFGDPLAASAHDTYLGLALALGIVAALYVLHGRLSVLAFDPGSARPLGARPGRTGAIFLFVLTLAIAAAANVAGSLLALALVTGPALAALAVCHRIGRAVFVSAMTGGTAGVAGMYLSYFADWPLAASVAAVAALAPLGAVGIAPVRRLRPAAAPALRAPAGP